MKSRLRLELQKYLNEKNYPMHMPGHKRRLMPEEDLPYDWDLTEVSGSDDLHHPSGILRDAMERTARLIHADRTWYLVSGSTVGNLAGVFALTHPDGEVIMDRCCHRSLFHIAQLQNLHVHWLMPSFNRDFGITGSIDPERVRSLLEQYPHTEAVIITCPTYEGVVSDVRGIASVCHQNNVPLFVDEAHGAHFGLSEEGYFPESAMQCGADISVQSFHKTLPSLTQTAVINMKRGLVDPQKVQQALDIFETSSPSYPLMVSLDACTEYLLKNGRECFAEWRESLNAFDGEIQGLQHLKVLCHQGDSPSDHGLYDFDPGKILIHSDSYGMNGKQLQDLLRHTFHFELEMSSGDNALAMTGPGDDPDALKRFGKALKRIDRKLSDQKNKTDMHSQWHLPETETTIRDAMEKNSACMDLSASTGRTSHEYVYSYPPGIPLLIPGEKITEEAIDVIRKVQMKGQSLYFSETEQYPDLISVCR